MGAWGTGLYSNDVSSDVRGDYRDALHFGKTNEEATAETIQKNKELIGSEDEELLWFSLADTQWNYGRLTPEIKEKALFFIENDADDRWETKRDQEAWKKTLEKLKTKLLTEQPPQKAVRIYHPFRCEWALGDVFAYRFESDISKECGFYNKYIVFRKVCECDSWPPGIIPIVNVYKWIGDTPPALSDLSSLPMLELPYDIADYHIRLNRVYNLELSITSKRGIPTKRLIYLGNLPGKDLKPYIPKSYYGYYDANWTARKPKHNFDYFMIRQFQKWGQTAMKEAGIQSAGDG